MGAEKHCKTEAPLEPEYITGPAEHEVMFSIATLVADENRYQCLVNSMLVKGFNSSNTQLIALDNRQGNNFDGFSYLRRAAQLAKGKYIVLTHDDIEFSHDGYDDLVKVLDELTVLDPEWGLAGNAGADGDRNLLRHIDDPYGVDKLSDIQRVFSIDENLMVVRRDRLVLGSADLTGFHFYGADLCLQAELQGSASYIIPFLVRHHSRGSRNEEYYSLMKIFGEKYGKIFPHREMRLPTAHMFLGGALPSQKLKQSLIKFRALLKRGLKKLVLT